MFLNLKKKSKTSRNVRTKLEDRKRNFSTAFKFIFFVPTNSAIMGKTEFQVSFIWEFISENYIYFECCASAACVGVSHSCVETVEYVYASWRATPVHWFVYVINIPCD